jgi:hypothetical protein
MKRPNHFNGLSQKKRPFRKVSKHSIVPWKWLHAWLHEKRQDELFEKLMPKCSCSEAEEASASLPNVQSYRKNRKISKQNIEQISKKNRKNRKNVKTLQKTLSALI